MNSWGFLSPASALWSGVAGLLLLLYLVRPRHRPQRVAAGFLWSRVATRLGGQPFWKRLQRHRLLLLQLLFCLLTVLALLRPYQVQPGRVGSRVVLLLDTSASMAAAPEGEVSRFEQSRKEALRILEQAPAQSEFLLAALDQELRLLQPFTAERAALRGQLQGLAPRALVGRDELALPFVNSLRRNHPEAECHWFSDHPLGGLAQVYHPATGGQINYAIDSLQVSPDRLFLALRSDDPAPVQLRLRLKGPDGFEVERSCALKGQGRQQLQLPWSGSAGTFTAELLNVDDFSLDNRAFAVLSGRTPGRIWLHEEVSPPLLRAVQAATGTGLVRAPRSSGQENGLHLWARMPPEAGPQVQVAQAPPTSWVAETVEDESGMLVVLEQRSLDPMSLRSLRWGPRVRLKSNLPGVRPLLTTPQGEPLLVEWEHSLIWLFPLECSDLPLSPELPVLLSSWLQKARNDALQLERGLLCGQRVRLPEGWPRSGQGPRGSLKLEHAHWMPDWPGWYHIGSQTVAVNFHAPEEFGPGRKSTPYGQLPTAAQDRSRAQPMAREWTRWLVLSALLVLLLELRSWWLGR